MTDHTHHTPPDDETLNSRPLPRRLRWGWLAWEATVGYIAKHHSPDATLKLRTQPYNEAVTFSASLSWADQLQETSIYTEPSLALKNLWEQTQHNHAIFLQTEDAFRSPIGYHDNEWFDENTEEVFLRLLRVIMNLLIEDWALIIFYRTSDTSQNRLQMRLLTDDSHAQRIVQSPTLRDACRDMLHHCALIHNQRRQT